MTMPRPADLFEEEEPAWQGRQAPQRTQQHRGSRVGRGYQNVQNSMQGIDWEGVRLDGVWSLLRHGSMAAGSWLMFNLMLPANLEKLFFGNAVNLCMIAVMVAVTGITSRTPKYLKYSIVFIFWVLVFVKLYDTIPMSTDWGSQAKP